MPTVEGWLVLRFVMGLGILFPWLLGETWINTVADDRSRGRVIALYTMAVFGGYGAGPIVLGLVPADGLMPFAAAGAAIVLTCLPLVLARHLAPPMEVQGASTGLLSVVRLFPVGMVAALIAGTLEYGYIALLPPFALRQGLDEGTALHLVSAFLWGGVALSVLFGWLADRMARERLIVVLSGAFVILAILAAAATTATPVVALLATFVLGGIACAFYTVGLAILGEQAKPRDLATANAAYLVLYQVGALGGPPVLGAAMDAAPDHGFVVAVSAFAILSAIAVALLPGRTAKRPVPGKAPAV